MCTVTGQCARGRGSPHLLLKIHTLFFSFLIDYIKYFIVLFKIMHNIMVHTVIIDYNIIVTFIDLINILFTNIIDVSILYIIFQLPYYDL